MILSFHSCSILSFLFIPVLYSLPHTHTTPTMSLPLSHGHTHKHKGGPTSNCTTFSETYSSPHSDPKGWVIKYFLNPFSKVTNFITPFFYWNISKSQYVCHSIVLVDVYISFSVNGWRVRSKCHTTISPIGCIFMDARGSTSTREKPMHKDITEISIYEKYTKTITLVSNVMYKITSNL